MDQALISPLDTGIIVGYFLLVLVTGYFLSRRITTGSEYFLAGKRLGWAAIGFSLFASNISSSSLVGLTGQAYASGISIANYEWMATIILVFMAIFIIPIFIKNRLSTVPEYLELRYSKFARRYYSAVTIVLTMMVDLASILFAGALVIRVFYPNIGILESCYTIALISGLYTAAGGLTAVVYTDILQSVILLMGSAIMLFAILGQYDFSHVMAMREAEQGHLSFFRPLGDANLPWLGTLVGVPVLGFYYWSTNQYVVQRILGARDLVNARRGALLAGFLKLSVIFLVVLPGIFALRIFPDLENPDMVYATMLLNLIPAGVVGLVLAGLLAALMSSADSALHASSTLIVLDFIQPNRPHLSPKQLAKYGRITTLCVMVVAGIWAPIIANFEGLFNYAQQVLSYSVPPIVVVFLGGFFWSRGTATAAKYTLIGGHILCFVALYLSLTGWIEIHFTILAGILTLICATIYILLSVLPKNPLSPMVSLSNLLWQTLELPEGRIDPWYSDYRILSMVLMALTFLILIWYF